MHELIHTYGYALVFLGTLLEGETVLVLGGFAAHRGYLHLPGVLFSALLGSTLGDMFFFMLGRRFGTSLISRWPGLNGHAARVWRLLERYDVPAIIAMRFAYGLRIAGPVVLGTSPIPTMRFLRFNVLGALIWTAVIGLLGYSFGNAMEVLLADLRPYEESLILLIAGSSLAAYLVRRWWRWRDERSAEAKRR